jgi:hypothetical protein
MIVFTIPHRNKIPLIVIGLDLPPVMPSGAVLLLDCRFAGRMIYPDAP